MLDNDPALTTASATPYSALAAISAGGNTDVTIVPGPASDDYLTFHGTANGSRKMLVPRARPVLAISISAGTAPYLATITLLAANAIAGDVCDLLLSLPASRNPRLEVHSLSATGSTLAIVPSNAWTTRWRGSFVYDGAGWALIRGGVERHSSASAPSPDKAQLSNVAAFVRAHSDAQLLYPLPRDSRRRLLFSNTDFVGPQTLLNGNKVWTSATSKYVLLGRGYGSFSVTMPPIGVGGDAVGTVRYVRIESNAYDVVTFKQSDGTTTIPTTNSTGNCWVILTAGATTWTAVGCTLEVIYYGNNAVFQHLGTAISPLGGTWPTSSLQIKQARTESWRVRFKFTGSRFWLRRGATGGNMRVYADGERLPVDLSPPNNGEIEWQRVEFLTSATREMEFAFADNISFGGIALEEAGANLAATDYALPSTRLGWISDSVGQQFGRGRSAIAETIADLLGWEAWVTPLGSTGYSTAGVSNPPLKFIDRIQGDLLAAAPNVIVVAGGINDPATNGTDLTNFRAAVSALYDYVDTNATGTPTKIALGPWWPRNSTPNGVNDDGGYLRAQIIREEAAARGWIFISQEGFNNGRYDAPTEPGDATINISDGTHPGVIGRRRTGVRLAYEILRALGSITPETA